ncbi:MAG: cation-translocating P-type ATPase [Gaiella sp.]
MNQPARSGLSAVEAAARLARDGPNVISATDRPRHLRRLAAQMTHFFALLLWAGAALAWLGDLPQLSAAIVAVILVNAVFAFFQEFRAERATEALRGLLPQAAGVRRDGALVEVPAAEIVVGDLLVLRAGDRVPADAELVERARLRVDNSVLTGESRPVEPVELVFAGTHVVTGSAEAVVTATGMATKFGRIAALTQALPRGDSPLERELRHVTRFVAMLAVAVGVAFFAVATALGIELQDRFVFAIGVMVALVPEGLLPTVTLALALATQRMAGRNALVRRLSAVETLGETTVICTDKTGTLTENQMTVQRVWTSDHAYTVEGEGYDPHGRFRRDGMVVEPGALADVLRAGLLCNDSRLVPAPGGWAVIGDPTEGALVVLAEKGGLRHETEAALTPRVGELPFDSARRRMSTVHVVADGWVVYTKGSADEIVRRSMLGEEERAGALAAAAELERDALRVLALARRSVSAGTEITDALEDQLEFLGLVGMLDPPRPEVRDALARCRTAGIRAIMVTGDSGLTAEAIARRIGLVEGPTRIVSGTEVASFDDSELAARLSETDVIFARVDPEEKLRIARLLRAQGEVVAMTGDGVNDAPALKEADIGIAMGQRGTDVAREAATMILLDDNFATIVDAIEEGRAVFDNLRRFTTYHFCSNVGELVPFVAWGVMLGAVPLPLTVMQVLAVDLGTDMLPAIALGTERPEAGTMQRPPRRLGERLLDRTLLRRVFAIVGPLEGLAALTGFFVSFLLAGWRPFEPLPDSGTVYVQATAMAYAGIVAAQVGAGLGLRTTRVSSFSVGIFSNRLLLVGIAVEIALLALLTETPGLRDAFHMEPLGPWHWLSLLVWPPLVLAVVEGEKAIRRRRRR